MHRGGQGVVYQALQESTKRKVALKVMLEGPFAGAASKRRFEREIELVGSLDHPGIVPIFDSGVAQGRFYYAMRYVRGESLSQYVHGRELSVDDTLGLFVKVCDAVDHAHQRGVIHRDLKPANILVDDEGQPHVVDFGLARIGGPDSERDRSLLVSVTGQVMGTLAYMSPEQAAGRSDQVDMRSDVYALGVVLYELLTGQLPYDLSGSMSDNLSTIQKCEPRQLSTSRRRIKNEAETIVLKALSKDKRRRYATAGMFGQDVAHFLHGDPIDAKRDSALYVLKNTLRRYKLPVAVAATLLLVITTALVVSLVFWGKAAREGTRANASLTDANRQRDLADIRLTEVTAAKGQIESQADQLRRRLYASRIMRAATAVTNGNLARGRELLDACPTELRGWEWKRLDWRATPKMLLMLQGQEQPLFTPDGKSLVSAGMGADSNMVKVWNLETGEARIALRGHTRRVIAIALSRDGKRIASCDWGGILKLWDMDSEHALWSIPGLGRIDGLTFSPDGTRIASVSWDRMLKLFATEDGEEIASKEMARQLRSVAFSAEGDRIVTAVHQNEPDGDAQVWEAVEGKELEPLFSLRGHEDTTSAVAFSPDGQRIVTGSNDGTLKIWEAATGDEVRRPRRGQAPPSLEAPTGRANQGPSEAPWTPVLTLRGHDGAVFAVSFSPDGRRIASGGLDQTVRLWEIATGRMTTVLTGHAGMLWWLSFRGDGKRLASFGWPEDGIRVWDTDVEPDEFSLPTDARAFAFHPRGTSVATGGHDGTIKVWDSTTGRLLRTFCGDPWPVRSLAYSSDGRSLVSCSGDRTQVWDPATGTLRRTLGGAYSVWAVAFSPDGAFIVSGSIYADPAVRLWESKTGKRVAASFDHRGNVWAVAFSPDGAQIASGGADRTLRLWDVETRRSRSLDPAPAALRALAFHPRGRRVAARCEDGAVRVWDVETGRIVQTLQGHAAQQVSAVAFSPDGSRLLSAADRTVKIWDLAGEGQELMTLPAPTPAAAGFSPDGRTIAVGGASELTLWETAPPPGGDEARRIVRQAREIVDQRFREDRFAYAVIEWLLAARTLAEPVREAAIQITRARRDPALHALVGERMRELFLPSAVVESLRGDESLPDRARTIAIEIASGPDDFDAYMARGDFYAGRTRWHEAIADYTEAIRTRPSNYIRPYLMRAEAYVRLKEYAKAAADYERYAELLKAGSFSARMRAHGYDNLARFYVTGPPEMRDAGKAIPLAEWPLSWNRTTRTGSTHSAWGITGTDSSRKPSKRGRAPRQPTRRAVRRLTFSFWP